MAVRILGARPKRDHRQLRAFQVADELAMAVYRDTRSFPPAEKFGLVSQLWRAAVSIASNIVEGCGRISDSDYLRFLDMASGTAREVEYQLSLATRLGFLPEDKESERLASEANLVLTGLIRAMRKSKAPREATDN